MHIPDGFLDAKTCVSTWALSIAGIAYCVRRTVHALEDRAVSLMGVMAAFIFAAQMINFPILGGTSGHLLGSVLAAVLLGPWSAAVVMFCVLTVQCLIFQDGGITALGANVLNMALGAACGGYFFYRVLPPSGETKEKIIARAGLAAWLSVVAGAFACSLELVVSRVSRLKVLLAAMLTTHAVIGIAEAVITGAVLGYILRVRPDLVYREGSFRE